MRTHIFVLIMLFFSLLAVVPQPTHAYIAKHNPNQPGGTWQDDGDAEILFIENDAYESHVVEENYEFQTAVWANVNNQRVTVRLHLKNVDLDHFCSADTSKHAYAMLIQKKDWVNDTYWTDTKKNIHNTSWVEGNWYEVDNDQWTHGYAVDISFLTSSSAFYPGMFEVDFKIWVHHPDFWNDGYEVRYKIWGLFTAGSMNGQVTHDPLYPNDYAEFKAEFGGGEWHARFYYAGKNPSDFSIHDGKVSGPDVKLMKDYGTYKNTQVTLKYQFNNTDPAGTYVFAFTNEYGGVTRNFYSWTVHNNATSLNNNTMPVVSVKFSGNFEINKQITITVSASDDKDTTIRVWLLVWYGNNMYLMPDPNLPLVVLYFYPLDVPNGGSKNVTISLTLDGQINVNAIARDSNDAWNITRASAAVKGFHTGGGGFLDTPENWFLPPWESTTNLVLLAVGVLFVLFPRNDMMKGIGILLIMASFVNWGYVGQRVVDYFTPNWGWSW